MVIASIIPDTVPRCPPLLFVVEFPAGVLAGREPLLEDVDSLVLLPLPDEGEGIDALLLDDSGVVEVEDVEAGGGELSVPPNATVMGMADSVSTVLEPVVRVPRTIFAD